MKAIEHCKTPKGAGQGMEKPLQVNQYLCLMLSLLPATHS